MSPDASQRPFAFGGDLILSEHAPTRSREQEQQVHQPWFKSRAFTLGADQEAARWMDLPFAVAGQPDEAFAILDAAAARGDPALMFLPWCRGSTI
jgi:hypothetical protein